MSGALAGFRVLDLSDSIAGQFCCRLMADFGAEVTLLEAPSGSPLRGTPPFDPAINGLGSLLFFHLNLGKGSIVLDRTTAEGRLKLIELAKQVDVIVVDVKADCEALLQANPACVVALVSEFGDDGPCRHWRGSEMIFQALSGMMYENGSPGREPLYGVGHRAQYAAGVGAYLTVLAALYARQSCGQGQQVAVEVAMNTAAMAMPATVEFTYSQLQEARGLRRNPFMVVKCNDAWVSIWVHLPVWPAFCRVANVPELEQDPRFAKLKDRLDNWPELTSRVQEQVRELSSDEFLDQLLKERIAGAKAYTPLQLWQGTPHLTERNFWQSVETDSGRRPVLGAPFRLSRTPATILKGSPRLGEQNPYAGNLAGAMSTPSAALAAARAALSGPGACQRSAVTTDSPDATRLGPLAGLRVLDLTTAWAGPMSGRILAFLGAEVIKVESASSPDIWRMHNVAIQARRYPDRTPGERPHNRCALFNSQNHNKLGLCLDIKHPAGLEAMHRLAATVDVVICNFTAGTLARMGLGYPVLANIKPDIIVLEMPGFGNTGALSKAAANGATMEMAAGMCAMIGYPDGAPMTTGQFYPDPIGGYNGAAAVMTALMHRQSSGEGQYIEMSQVEASMQFIGDELLHAIAAGQDPLPLGNRARGLAPHDAYPASGDDQWVAIAIGSDDEWQKFCGLLGDDTLANDTRFTRFEDRWNNQQLLRDSIAVWTRQHSKTEIADRLQAAGIRCAPVNQPNDVVASRYLASRQAFVTMTHPEAGTHAYPSLPFRLSRTPGSQRRASPCLGADTRRILIEMAGLTAGEVDALDAAGVTSSVPTV